MQLLIILNLHACTNAPYRSCTLMQDVIPEVMQWKQFPNHYLIANENHRRLASVWKPRWSDPFSSDLLPAQANGASELQLLTGPQPDDYVDPEW